MPVLDIQRRGQQLGRIRLGEQAVARNGKSYPKALAAFRFTTPSLHTAQAVADLFGGQVRQWERGQYEIYTSQNVLSVTIPPRDQVISQWYEMWSKGGCQRRCDSQTEHLSGTPCMCPHAEDPTDLDAVEAAAKLRAERAKLNPPKACKLVTRLSVMIPDLPDLGVWRVDTASFWAAGELGDKAEVMQAARDCGYYLPALLRIEQRERIAGGKTTRYPVLVLQILKTLREIVTGAIAQGGIAAQLPPAMGNAKAISASAASAPVVSQPQGNMSAKVSAQDLADQVAAADTRAQVEQLAAVATDEELLVDLVCTDPDQGVYEVLKEFLSDRWKSLPRPDEPNEQGEQEEDGEDWPATATIPGADQDGGDRP